MSRQQAGDDGYADDDKKATGRLPKRLFLKISGDDCERF